MKQSSYHHGNLKKELIEAGIRIVNEVGLENLSLRKAAAMCGVSHAAPKSHFEDKEKFVESIKQYVTEEFTIAMQLVVEENKVPGKMIEEFGIAYIQYFVNHPENFMFITNQKDIDILVSDHYIRDCAYMPFQIFQLNASKVLEEKKMPKEAIPKQIIKLWAMVYGLSAISVMKGFHYEGEWMAMVKSIINNN